MPAKRCIRDIRDTYPLASAWIRNSTFQGFSPAARSKNRKRQALAPPGRGFPRGMATRAPTWRDATATGGANAVAYVPNFSLRGWQQGAMENPTAQDEGCGGENPWGKRAKPRTAQPKAQDRANIGQYRANIEPT